MVEFELVLEGLSIDMELVEVYVLWGVYSMFWLRNVEGVVIYVVKKSEFIELEKVMGNLVVNNVWEIYKGVLGFNIWENDGVGF